MPILSEEAKKLGITVGWDPTTKNVTVGDKTYTPDQLKGAGLTMANGRWQGDTTSILNPTPTQVPAPPTMVSPQPATTVQPAQSLDDQILATKKAQTIRDLENMFGKQTGALNTELSTIAPTYAQKKTDARVQNTLSAKDFENFLMQKGLGQSGSAAQGEIASSVALQGNLGQLNTAEANALADIEKRRSQLATDLEYGKQSASGAYDLATLEAQRQANILAEEIAREDAAIAKSDTQAAETKKVNDFLATIGRFYQNYSGQAKIVSNDGDPSNDWQIPYLEQASQEKIVNEGRDPKTGALIPADNTQAIWDQALTKWNAGIPLTGQEMQILGTTTTTKPVKMNTGGSGSSTTVTQDRNYQMDRWEILGVADEAISQVWGVPVGTPVSQKPQEQPEADINQFINYVDNYLVNKDEITGKKTVNRQGVAKYIYDLLASNDVVNADALAKYYGITDGEIEAIERSIGNRR